MTSDKLIKFNKVTLDNLTYRGKDEYYFAENFEGLCIKINKRSKAYYAHWSIPKINKATGKVTRAGLKKKIAAYNVPLAEVKAIIRSNLDEFKKLSKVSESSLTVGGLVSEFLKHGFNGTRVRTRGKRISYKPKTVKGYKHVLQRYILLKAAKDHVELKEKMTKPIRHQGKYFQGALKDIPLDRVSRTDIEIFMERLSDIPAAANNSLAALSVAFEFDMQRVTDHLYKGSNNPCIRVTKYPIQKDKKYLELEKVREIMDYIKNNQFRDPHFLTYWALLVQVGERQSDKRGLYWKEPANVKLEQKKGCTGWLYKKFNEQLGEEIMYVHIIDSKNRKPANVDVPIEMEQLLLKLDDMIRSNPNLTWAVSSKFIFPQTERPDLPITENSYRFKMERFNYKFGLSTRAHVRSTGKKRKLYKYTNIFTLKHCRKTFGTHYGREHGVEAGTERFRQSSADVFRNHYFTFDKANTIARRMYSPRQSRSKIKPRAIVGGKNDK